MEVKAFFLIESEQKIIEKRKLFLKKKENHREGEKKGGLLFKKSFLFFIQNYKEGELNTVVICFAIFRRRYSFVF